MNVLRRSAAVLAATAVIGAAMPTMTALAADDPSPSASAALPSGLYGSTDPKYDGVWRQSLALLAQHTAGVTPAAKAVDWLAGQQCANGAFAAFRAEPTAACDAKVTVDTNSTAAAVQALKAVGGHDSAVGKAVTWLKSQQNKDGGWGYAPGSPSDTNSTGVVIGALAAAGASADRTPYDLLAKWSIPCDQDGGGGGGLAYQPDKTGKLTANADATAAGVLGALGKGFAATAGKAPVEGYICADSDKARTRDEVARNGAEYLADAVHEKGYLVSALPGAKPQPDYGNTADAVVAMAAQGWTKPAKKSYAWLTANSAQWAKQSGPAAYAELIFAAHAMGADPRDFGGTDLVTALNATGPAPRAAAAEHTGAKKSSGTSVWWIVGTGLVAGIGIGFLFSGRRKQRQL
ncbi:prenyltransferase/squalene oxidase-like repeat protein [Streptomyces sp. Ag109_O5-1]|uniref:prenyltransferase/squalene oxidase repeat-containing protein n=1 Tax=Streptomyces sp. Ag109_O5-1 TaxID=1938851 RepID=UPI000F4F11F7|nr:prenyltransferase/squalene oxidase repeat-containing protein [Streptomyces sp. Ag109_O5-1]RPE44343.1 prenyltransferase/squalene oxidase-like repeat protein [Streptomyces sp. Ag109_O5-1]